MKFKFIACAIMKIPGLSPSFLILYWEKAAIIFLFQHGLPGQTERDGDVEMSFSM